MSWNYSYTLGVKTKDGKIYPIGPFDADGKIVDVINNSRSFEPEELDEGFYPINKDNVTPEFEKVYSYELDREKYLDLNFFSYIPLADLPHGDGLKFGYFLIEDVDRYEKSRNSLYDFDGFYDWMEPKVYYAKAINEITYGAPKEQKDEEGGDITPHSAGDYMPYAFIDTSSAAYMAERIRQAHYMYDDWVLAKKYGKGYERVVILLQG